MSLTGKIFDDAKLLMQDSKPLFTLLIVGLVCAVLLLVSWLGYGLFRLTKASERFMDATTVPADINSWKSRHPGGGDRMAQDFSGTNQGGQNTSLTNVEVGMGRQGLVVGRGNGPDFWEISSMLGDYQSQDGKAEGGGYWSPDLNAWLSEDEVAALPSDQRNNVQFYGSAAAMKAAAALQPAAAAVAAQPAVAAATAEYFRKNQNALLSEQFRVNQNALLSPEERMLSENFELAPEVRSEQFGQLLSADKALFQRSGVY
jgi:hypothetical protein